MKKPLIALMITSLAFSPLAYSDSSSDVTTTEEVINPPQNQTPTQEVVSPQEPYGDLSEAYEEEEEDETPQGTEVGSAENPAEGKRRREFWTNIIIASAAVVVAVVSILVVSNNNGKAPKN